MSRRMMLVCVGACTALAASVGAHAQKVVACPAGHAIQSTDGKTAQCVAVPDAAALQSAIGAEAAARIAVDNAEAASRAAADNIEAAARAVADAQLQANIDNEANLRNVMDTALQNAIDKLGQGGGGETGISGTYTFSGTQVCISSTFGFNDDLTPASSPDSRGAVISQSTAISSGTRTFVPDATGNAGTGTTQVSGFTIGFPGVFYTNPPPPGFPVAGVGTIPGAPGKPGGNATAFEQAGNFTWRIEGNRLIIDDGIAEGTTLQGNVAGCTVTSSNLPPSAGTLGKDLRIISMIPERIRIETITTSCPDGRNFTSQRICNRERLLRKM